MDPFELLKRDHETVAGLFDRIESASGKAKLRIFQQIKSALELHTHIEEVIFYPALEKRTETRDLTLEAYEEHKVVKNLLSELGTARSVSDEWDAKLKVLKENVEHHVDEEQNELFDKANDVLPREEAERLGDRMSAEKVRQGAPAPDTEEPGLLRKIAYTLGIGTGPKKANKKPARTPAVKKTGRVAAKGPGPTSTKSSKAPANRRESAKNPSGTKSRSTATRKSSARKSVAGKSAKAGKKRAARKAGRKR